MLIPLVLAVVAGQAAPDTSREVVLDLARLKPGFVYRLEVPAIGQTCVYFGNYLPHGLYSESASQSSRARRREYSLEKTRGCEAAAQAVDALFSAQEEEDLVPLLRDGGLVDQALAETRCSSLTALRRLRERTRWRARCTAGLGPQAAVQVNLKRHAPEEGETDPRVSKIPQGRVIRSWSIIIEVSPPPSGPSESFSDLVVRVKEAPAAAQASAVSAFSQRIHQIASTDRSAIESAAKGAVWLLDSPDLGVRDAALAALRALGPPAEPVQEALLSMVRDTAPAPALDRASVDHQRAAALELLADLQPTEDQVLFQAATYLKDASTQVRLAAVRALGRLATHPTVWRLALETATHDDDSAVREAARQAVATIEATRLVSVEVERAAYRQRLATVLLRADFEQLEKEAAQLRDRKTRLSSGASKLWAFYDALNPRADHVRPELRERFAALLWRWSQERPNSITPRIPLIAALAQPAEKPRSRVPGEVVRKTPAEDASGRLEAAWARGEEALKLPDLGDPGLYNVLLQVALARGQGPEVWEPLLRRCRELDPGFLRPYLEVAGSLMPGPGGSTETLERFASEAAARISDALGDGLYARIAGEVLIVRRDPLRPLDRRAFDWERIKRGFADLDERFPRSSFNTNLFARLAVLYGDAETVAALFERLGNHWCSDSEALWNREGYLQSRARYSQAGPGPITVHLPEADGSAPSHPEVRFATEGTLEEVRAAALAASFGEGPSLAELRAACDRGEMSVCTSLGLRYGSGKGVEADRAEATRLYQRACDGGHAPACFNLAVMLRQGVGASRDEGRAAPLFERACAGDFGSACFAAGVLYEKGTVPGDEAKAAARFDAACRLGDPEGCYRLGLSQVRAVFRLTESPEAVASFDKACRGGFLRGCLGDDEPPPMGAFGRNYEVARIRATVAGFLEAGLFRDLEARIGRIRDEQRRLSNGLPALCFYYEALFPAPVVGRDLPDGSALDRWAGVDPGSYALKMGQLYREILRAFDTHKDHRRPIGPGSFAAHVEDAWRIASEAERLGTADADLYNRFLVLCIYLGKPWREVEAYLDRGLAIDPAYEPLFLDAAQYLLPRWHGSPEEFHRFAQQAVERTRSRLGTSVYARLAMLVAVAEGEGIREMYPFDWPQLKQAFSDLRSRYPHSDEILRAYAWFVWLYRDTEAAPDALEGLRWFDEREEQRDAECHRIDDTCLEDGTASGLTAGAVLARWPCRSRILHNEGAESTPWGGDRPWMTVETIDRVRAWLEQPLRQSSGPS